MKNRIIGGEPKIVVLWRIIKNIFTKLVSFILMFMILINLVIIVKMYINPNKIPDFFGYKNFIITSGSMKPTIEIKDFIIVKEVPIEKLQKNDIITFRENNTVVTHRIINIQNDNGKIGYVTKGDNNNVEDANKVYEENIEGKYIATVPFVGYIVGFAQTTAGLIILLIIPITIFLFVFWKNQTKKVKELLRNEKRIQYTTQLKNKRNMEEK